MKEEPRLSPPRAPLVPAIQKFEFKALVPDMQLQVLSFLDHYDLISLRKTGRVGYKLASAEFLWQSMCFKMQQSTDQKKPDQTWEQYFKSLACYRFDPTAYTKSLQFSLDTITSTSAVSWANARCTKRLRPGRCYRWKFKIINTRHNVDSWYMIFGVESPTFPYEATLNSHVIGFTNNKGYGFLPVIGKKIHNNYKNVDVSVGKPWLHNVKRGDEIGIVFDMTKSSEEADALLNDVITKYAFRDYKICIKDPNHAHMLEPADLKIVQSYGAKISFYLNGVSLGVFYHGMTGLDWYPAVSLTGLHTVQICSFT